MENLKNYTSDFDSSSEEEEHSFTSKNVTHSTNSDFFNLELSPKKVSPSNKREHLESVLEKEEKKTDGELQVPVGDFWKGFDPSQSDLNEIPTTSFPLEPYIQENNSSTINTHSQKESFKHCCYLEEAESLQPLKRICKRPETFEKKVEDRKIFFVHHKITTGLSSRTVCKCVSIVDSSWPCHDSAINRLSWNIPNYSHLVATAGMDSVIRICNVWSKLDKCSSAITTHSKAVKAALWGHAGKTIISGSYDKTAAVTDVETGTALSQLEHQSFVTACAKQPSNYHCFVSGSENVIQMWDQRTPTAPVKSFWFKDKLGQVQDLLFIQDGQELLSCSDIVARDSADRTIMSWDVRSGVVLSNQIFQERYTCTRLKLHPSNSHFLAQTQGGYVAAFSTCRPYKLNKSKRFEGHQMQGYSIGFDLSHDGQLLYSGSAEGGIHCYDYYTGRLIKKCSTHKNSIITDVASHPVLSSVLVACSWGGHISLWH